MNSVPKSIFGKKQSNLSYQCIQIKATTGNPQHSRGIGVPQSNRSFSESDGHSVLRQG